MSRGDGFPIKYSCSVLLQQCVCTKTRDREKETDGQTDGRALVQVKRGRCGRDRHNESNIISSFKNHDSSIFKQFTF